MKIELKERELKRLSADTLYQIMSDESYSRMTRISSGIMFLRREVKQGRKNKADKNE